jgi:hypothetical protein
MVIGPIDSVKCKQYGAGAIVSYTQVTTDSVWISIQQSLTQIFPGGGPSTTPTYVGNTIASHMDTISNVLNTNVTWVRIVSYADSLGLTPIDTTLPVVMTRPTSVVFYTLTPVIGGFKSNVMYDPGNSVVNIKGTWGLDVNFQSSFVFLNTTAFSVGLTLSQYDSVNVTSPTTPTKVYWKFETTQSDGTTDVRIDTITTLSNGAPYINWYGQATSGSTTIHVETVEERYGVPSTRRIYYENMITSAVDSVITVLPAGTGGQVIAPLDLQSLAVSTQYKIYGNLENVNGISHLVPIFVTTTQIPSALGFDIQSINVSNDVDANVAYTNIPTHSCNATVGYGMFGSSVLMYSANYPNLMNDGSFTASFVLPPTTGNYTMHMSGYDEQTFFIGQEDTMSFVVSSLTGLNNPAMTNEYSLMTRVEVRDITGRLLHIEKGKKLVPQLYRKEWLENGVYLISAFNKDDKMVYTGKVFFQK